MLKNKSKKTRPSLPTQPARQIKGSKVKFVGKVPIADRMVLSEGSIEYAYYSLIRHDPNVKTVLEQPVRINYVDAKGKKRYYTPDALVQFRDTSAPHLVEIKSVSELEHHADEFAERFAAARAYATEHGWEFKVINETQIRGFRLDNLEFLAPYKRRQVSDQLKTQVLEYLEDCPKGESCTIRTLLEGLSKFPTERLQLIPVVWHLVAQGLILVDLEAELTMSNAVSLVRKEV